jgi:hypothetical protein
VPPASRPLRKLGFLTIGLFDGEDPRRGHESTLEIIELGERLGFNSAWLRHRHLQYGISSPVAVLAAASQRTRRIELGTAVTPLGWENPLRLAEDLATVDHRSRPVRCRGARSRPRLPRPSSCALRRSSAPAPVRAGLRGSRQSSAVLATGPQRAAVPAAVSTASATAATGRSLTSTRVRPCASTASATSFWKRSVRARNLSTRCRSSSVASS